MRSQGSRLRSLWCLSFLTKRNLWPDVCLPFLAEAFSFGRNCAANATTDWAVKDLVSMRFHLINQRQVLQRAHDDLEAKFSVCSLPLGDRICRPDVEIYIQKKDFYNMVVRERDEFKDQISRQRNVGMELQRQRNRLLMHISKLGEFY